MSRKKIERSGDDLLFDDGVIRGRRDLVLEAKIQKANELRQGAARLKNLGGRPPQRRKKILSRLRRLAREKKVFADLDALAKWIDFSKIAIKRHASRDPEVKALIDRIVL